MLVQRKTWINTVATLSLLAAVCFGCKMRGGSAIAGNENGTQPVNEREVNEYRRAILKCYKTGGSRVVKIAGELRCFD